MENDFPKPLALNELLGAELLLSVNEPEGPCFDVFKELQADFANIFDAAGIPASKIEAGYLIGSYARKKEISPYSDVDVLAFSHSLKHIETILRWNEKLYTLYVYSFDKLEEGLSGPDSLYWIQSLREAIPVYGNNVYHSLIAEAVKRAADVQQDRQKNLLLPCVLVRRLIEYRRKTLAVIRSIGLAKKPDDDVADMQLADASRKFAENYILLQHFMRGKGVESESGLYEIARNISQNLRQALVVCLCGQRNKLPEAMSILLTDIHSYCCSYK